MSLHVVEITYRVVVVADSSADAHRVTVRNLSAIARDEVDPDIDVTYEILTRRQIPDGWEEDCLPYGGDDERTIIQHLQGTP